MGSAATECGEVPYPSTITPASFLGNSVCQNNFGFEYLGNSYLFLIDGDPFGPVPTPFRAFKSLDKGLTWAEQDAIDAPGYPTDGGTQLNVSFVPQYTIGRDGSKVILLWVNATHTTPPENWINLTISKVVYDLSTDTWVGGGAITTVAAPFMGLENYVNSTPFPNAANPRAYLQLLVKGPSNYLLYVSGVNDIEGGQPVGRCSYVTYDGTTFGPEVPIPGQLSGTFYWPAGAVIDNLGNTHFLMNGGTFNSNNGGNVWHVAMDSTNTFGALVLITSSMWTAAAQLGPQIISAPTLNLGQVVFVVAIDDGSGNNNPTLFSLTPVLVPVVTTSVITTNPLFATQDIPRTPRAQAFSVASNGTDIVVASIWWDGSPAPTTHFLAAKSRAVAPFVWNTDLAFDPPIDANLFVAAQVLVWTITGGFAVFGEADGHFNNVASTQSGFVASLSPSPSASVRSGSGRWLEAGICRKRKNIFDWCMFLESLGMSQITFPPLCAIPPEFRQQFPLPWNDDFGANAIPPGAVPFSRVGSILTPADLSPTALVVQERVPYGYDGLLAGFFTGYTGQGFDQGSGDITWRLQLNQRYLKDLGNLPFALGSSVSPCPLTEGQILLSGQLLKIMVDVVNASGPPTRILGGLFGFYWPR